MNNEKIYAVYRANAQACKKDEFVCYAASPYFTELELENCLGNEAVIDIDRYIAEMDDNILHYQESYDYELKDEAPDNNLLEELKNEMERYQEFKKEAEQAKYDGCTFAIVNTRSDDDRDIAYWFFDENEKVDTILSPNMFYIAEVDEN